MTTQMYGSSDDCICFDGDMYGEIGQYNTSEIEPVMVAFSDGTVANIWYGDEGIWKIELLNKGTMYTSLEPCTDPQAKTHSDVLSFSDGPIRAWYGGELVQ